MTTNTPVPSPFFTNPVVERIVTVGGGFASNVALPQDDSDGTWVETIATLREPVKITFNGSDRTQPRNATIVALSYLIKRDGRVQVSLKRSTDRLDLMSPHAVISIIWEAPIGE